MEENNNQTATSSLEETSAPNSSELEELKIKNEELANNWKRAVADLENYKRRKEQEISGILEMAKEAALMHLMPSLQSLEQVLKYAPNDDKYKNWLDGLKATIMQLEKAMDDLGVIKIKTVGEKFNHGLHEAVEEDEQVEDGIVAREIQPGFTLNGRLVVAAKVAVGKKK
jgi:molecular chaperone GrpE